MKRTALALFVLTSAASVAQMTMTPAQHARLMKQRGHVITLQLRKSRAEADIAFALAQFQQSCRKVAAENGWPADTQCDVMTLTPYQSAPPQTPHPLGAQPPEKKDESEKK